MPFQCHQNQKTSIYLGGPSTSTPQLSKSGFYTFLVSPQINNPSAWSRVEFIYFFSFNLSAIVFAGSKSPNVWNPRVFRDLPNPYETRTNVSERRKRFFAGSSQSKTRAEGCGRFTIFVVERNNRGRPKTSPPPRARRYITVRYRLAVFVGSSEKKKISIKIVIVIIIYGYLYRCV